MILRREEECVTLRDELGGKIQMVTKLTDRVLGRARIVWDDGTRYKVRMLWPPADKGVEHWLIREHVLVSPMDNGSEGRLVIRHHGLHLIPD